jgi:hypothetical protein
MPIYSSWIVEGHLVYWKSWGALKSEDIAPYDAESFAMLDATTAPLLHTIADHSQLEQLPSLKDLATISVARDPRVGWYLVAGSINPIIKMLVSIAVQIGHVRLRFFPTFDEALAFIKEQDATLPPIGVTEADLIERIRARHAAVSAEPTPF